MINVFIVWSSILREVSIVVLLACVAILKESLLFVFTLFLHEFEELLLSVDFFFSFLLIS